MPGVNRFDPRSLEIKTKSIEKTLVPLVSQITVLVNYRERYSNKSRNDKANRALLKVGSAVRAAVERFVTVGESIADENAEIQPEMYNACQEARAAGSTIAGLPAASVNASSLKDLPEVDAAHADQQSHTELLPSTSFDRNILLRAARQLLASVTRVLLLADRVVVKETLKAEDKVAYSLTRLESTNNFTEFVKIFTLFGGQMVDLAHKTGDRQQDLKSDKRQAQIHTSRNVLEKFTLLLLTSSKTLLRHPDCESARQTRDGVFRRIRLALHLVALCICDGALPFDATSRNFLTTFWPLSNSIRLSPVSDNPTCLPGLPNVAREDEPLDISLQLTASVSIRQLLDTLELVRMTGNAAAHAGIRERLLRCLDSVIEMTQDFTDSAYTSHQDRERLLDLIEESRYEMNELIKIDLSDDRSVRRSDANNSNLLSISVQKLGRVLQDLRKQLQTTALEQVGEIFRKNEDQVILASMKALSVAGDIDGVEQYMEKFREHSEHVQEVCRLLYHISMTDALHVYTGHAERNLSTLAPLLILAGRTLCLHPSSRIARENLEVFCDTWADAVNDLSRLAKETDAACCGQVVAEKQAYMSLPKPGKHGATSKPMKPVTLDVEDQQKIAKVGLEMKLLTSEVDAEAEKWDEYAENDIVKRAKNMSSMAYNMYLFTRGNGPLKTTHDLFTQAEFFAEEANKMYKTVLEFSYEVPGSSEKNNLLPVLEKIPAHCQQLQVLVKNPTVGKSATFSKVDSVIQETKNLMNEIALLVTACFICATKFDIEFRGTSMSAVRLPALLNGYGSGLQDANAAIGSSTSRSGHSSSFRTACGGGGLSDSASQWRRAQPAVRRSKSQPRVSE